VPWIQRRSRRRRELYWHLCIKQVHGRSQGGTVFSGRLLLKYPTFIIIMRWDSGDKTMSLHNFQTALLWCFMQRACRYSCRQVRRTYGLVSTAFVLLNEHAMVGYLSGRKRCLRAFPIYWLVWNLISCFIWVSEICRLV
jgi:hypothetical protein